jgi:hypothetical protein
MKRFLTPNRIASLIIWGAVLIAIAGRLAGWW